MRGMKGKTSLIVNTYTLGPIVRSNRREQIQIDLIKLMRHVQRVWPAKLQQSTMTRELLLFLLSFFLFYYLEHNVLSDDCVWRRKKEDIRGRVEKFPPSSTHTCKRLFLFYSRGLCEMERESHARGFLLVSWTLHQEAWCCQHCRRHRLPQQQTFSELLLDFALLSLPLSL